MSFDRPSRHKSDSIASANSTQGKLALRYVLSVVLVIYLAAAGLLTALAIENVSTLVMEVHLTFFRQWTLTVPVGVLLLFCCALGGLLLYGVTALSAWHDWSELARLRKRVAALEQAQRSGSAGENAGAQPSPPSSPVPMPGVRISESLSAWKWLS